MRQDLVGTSGLERNTPPDTLLQKLAVVGRMRWGLVGESREQVGEELGEEGVRTLAPTGIMIQHHRRPYREN